MCASLKTKTTAPLQIEIGMQICLPSRVERTRNSGIVEDEEHLCVGCPGLKEARGHDGTSSIRTWVAAE